ncbi:hypothetical protein TcWFU_000820 [Taenia crassiceps]|uniref:Uncharacterized protein n=1 Tax=Taenia crassiceps TaxID=6207 RepID=A0ABR4QG20_9CEST
MKAFCAVLFTVLVVIALTVAAEEPKSHEEEKRMLYWKRGGLEDLDDEELGTYDTLELNDSSLHNKANNFTELHLFIQTLSTYLGVPKFNRINAFAVLAHYQQTSLPYFHLQP